MSEEAKKTLAAKLAEVMGEVKRIPKRGKNTFHNYNYVTEADLADAIRDHLSARGIVFIPNTKTHELREHGETARGKKNWLTVLGTEYIFTDGTESISFMSYGYGIDGEDKGIYKAITGAEKYALMKFFLVPTGDDPEEDRSGEGARSDVAKLKKSSSDNRGHGNEGFHEPEKQSAPVKTEPPRQEAHKEVDTANIIDVMIVSIDHKETGKGARYLLLKDVSGIAYFVWHESLHDYFNRPFMKLKLAAKGKVMMRCVFTSTKGKTANKEYISVENLININGTRFEENLPVIELER